MCLDQLLAVLRFGAVKGHALVSRFLLKKPDRSILDVSGGGGSRAASRATQGNKPQTLVSGQAQQIFLVGFFAGSGSAFFENQENTPIL